VSAPGRRRIYSNTGIEVAAAAVGAAADMDFAAYAAGAVLEPLAMTSSAMHGSPAHGLDSTVRDLIALLVELQRPQLLSSAGATAVATIQYPTLTGILRGGRDHVVGRSRSRTRAGRPHRPVLRRVARRRRRVEQPERRGGRRRMTSTAQPGPAGRRRPIVRRSSSVPDSRVRR